MVQGLAILFGAVVGVSLGLTGGGGGILAVPMLVYGVGLPPRDAVLVSLMAVGATALIGAIERLRRREVEIVTGLVFALAGIVGAPLGAKLVRAIRPEHLLLLFSALMVYVAYRMWNRPSSPRDRDRATASRPPAHEFRTVRTMNARDVMMMMALGMITGVLSGLFGVGGGFLIVPALVLVSGMEIHRAVATSLLIIPLVSISGIVQHLRQQEAHALDVMLLFVIGGVAGMMAGTLLGRRLSPVVLQKVFAVVIVGVAVFNVAATLAKDQAGHEFSSTQKRGSGHVLPSTLHSGAGDRVLHGGG